MAASLRSGAAAEETTDAAPASYPAMTRLQSFRYRNRHKPLKQALYFIGFMVLMAGYGYLFFGLQPNRSYENVSLWNAAMDFRIKQIQAERQEQKHLRQKEREAERARGSDDDAAAPDPLFRVLSFVLIYMTCTNILRQYLINRRNSMARQMDNPVWSRIGMGVVTDDRQGFTRGDWPTVPPSEYPPIASLELERLMALRLAVERQLRQTNFHDEIRGADASQVAAYPVRTLDAPDDPLLAPRDDGPAPQCDICLEPYRVGSAVRTIPCFHAFHADCIDAWLAQRAACPVCLHPL